MRLRFSASTSRASCPRSKHVRHAVFNARARSVRTTAWPADIAQTFGGALLGGLAKTGIDYYLTLDKDVKTLKDKMDTRHLETSTSLKDLETSTSTSLKDLETSTSTSLKDLKSKVDEGFVSVKASITVLDNDLKGSKESYKELKAELKELKESNKELKESNKELKESNTNLHNNMQLEFQQIKQLLEKPWIRFP